MKHEERKKKTLERFILEHQLVSVHQTDWSSGVPRVTIFPVTTLDVYHSARL